MCLSIYYLYKFIYFILYKNYPYNLYYMLYLLFGGYIWENIASNPGYTAQSPEFLMLTLKLPVGLK